jgi:hypothetical protein
MKHFRKYLLWVGGFLLISTINFCSHQMSFSKSDFGYQLLTDPQSVNDSFIAAGPFYTVAAASNQKTAAITWEALKDVTYQIKFNKQYQMDFQYPVFGNEIKKMEGKEVNIKGYMIPLDVNQGLYALSRYPYSSCYFCGKSGPESVVSLKFKTKPKKFKMDAIKTMKGILYLNENNPMDFIYIFNNAEEYDAPE